MRLNYYNAIFVITDPTAFAYANFGHSYNKGFGLLLLVRLGFTSIFLFPISNTLLVFDDIFKKKSHVLLYTYLFSYLLIVLMIALFSNKTGNIFDKIIELHMVKSSFAKLFLPYLFSFIFTLGLYAIFKTHCPKGAKIQAGPEQ